MRGQSTSWLDRLEAHLPGELHWVWILTAAVVYALLAIAEAISRLEKE